MPQSGWGKKQKQKHTDRHSQHQPWTNHLDGSCIRKRDRILNQTDKPRLKTDTAATTRWYQCICFLFLILFLLASRKANLSASVISVNPARANFSSGHYGNRFRVYGINPTENTMRVVNMSEYTDRLLNINSEVCKRCRNTEVIRGYTAVSFIGLAFRFPLTSAREVNSSWSRVVSCVGCYKRPQSCRVQVFSQFIHQDGDESILLSCKTPFMNEDQSVLSCNIFNLTLSCVFTCLGLLWWVCV